MPRPSVFRAALAGLLAVGFACSGAVVPVTAAPAAHARPAEDQDALLVHIDTIDPVLPRSGDVEITGTVTNTTDTTFTRVNLHAFSSQSPILDSAALAGSALLDPTQDVGPRVTVPGTFDTIDEIPPGETAMFSDTVPVDLFGIPADEEGVYWIGVHAFGDGAVPRDGVADGRARTFIPARPSGGDTQEASVILSVRSRVWFDSEGRIAGTDRWQRRLAEGGSLEGALDMAESAGSTPYSWLVDPAVLLALARLAAGNPPRSLAPDTSVPGQEPTPTETPTDPASGTATPETLTPTPPEPTKTPNEDEAALAAAASAWLARFTLLVGTTPVLTLPFGDLDVSAAVRNDRSRYDQAIARGAEVMAALALPSRPAVAPEGDVLSPEAIAAVAPETVIMLGDNAFAVPPTSRSSVVRLLGHKVVVTSTGAEAGGPGPTAANDPLALRQRLLSEAALRLANDDPAPLVVTLPTVWRGEDAAAFFGGLEQSWLDLVPAGEVADGSAVGVPASSLAYTDEDRDAELDSGSFTAATRATDAAALLEQVLTLQTTVEASVREEVLVTLSEQHRLQPRLALRAAGRVEESLRDEIGKITIEVPKAVTLSSDSGPLGATLVNGLDQPVTVQVMTSTDGELTLSLEGDSTRRLGPSARSVLRYRATTDQPGVHNVRLIVTSQDGVPLGSVGELPIRAAQVSALIWIAMAAGALVLFGMIGYRLPGQIRARRAELAAQHEAQPEAQPETQPETARHEAPDAPAADPVSGAP